MSDPAQTEPPRLFDQEIIVLYRDPLVGVMRLETSGGLIEVALNFAVADALAKALAEFMDEDTTT